MTKKIQYFPFLKTGYASFPLRDVGKKFEVANTWEIEIKKPRFLENGSNYMHFFINHREIENAVWEEIKKSHKNLLKEADWLVISMIKELGDKLNVSVDTLKEV